jgi:hypothetical protein
MWTVSRLERWRSRPSQDLQQHFMFLRGLALGASSGPGLRFFQGPDSLHSHYKVRRSNVKDGQLFSSERCAGQMPVLILKI